MPKEWEMTQISRLFQIVLVLMGLFVAVWFVGMRGHSAGSGSSPSSAPAPAASPATAAPGAPSPVYHGTAPGVEGLTHAIAKAHAVVRESESEAKQLQESYVHAPSTPSTSAVAGTSSAGAAHATARPGGSTVRPGTSARAPWTSSWVGSKGSTAAHAPSAVQPSVAGGLAGTHGVSKPHGPAPARAAAPTHGPAATDTLAGVRGVFDPQAPVAVHRLTPTLHRASTPVRVVTHSSVAAHGPVRTHGSTATRRSATATPPAGRATPSATPTMQLTVERELKQGKLVTILFWSPGAPVDQAVRRELQTAARAHGSSVVVHVAPANQVGSFGSLTRAVGVYQTPTILFVNARGRTMTVTGLADAFSIEQAIAEARQP
jgi:hypothetical protein